MSRWNIVVTDKILLTDQHQEQLRKLGNVQIFHDIVSEEILIKRLQDADIALIGFVELPAKVLYALPHLQMISIWATGYDSVDIQVATEKNIVVTHVPSYAGQSVAELVLGLILAHYRRIIDIQPTVTSGVWFPPRNMGLTVHNKTLGIVGMGAIGQAVTRIAYGFDMYVLATTKNPSSQRAKQLNVTFVSLFELLKQSDIVVLSLPLNSETYHLIDEHAFECMRRHALLVNVSRGEIVDEPALLRAIETGQIQGAALDVASNEFRTKHIQSACAYPSQILMTPHIGYYTLEAASLCTDIAIQNIKRFIQGIPENVVKAG